MALRIGHGYDLHRLEAGRPLVLGGIELSHDRGLAGWSDADVVCHALADALLGAAGLEDLGRLYPPGEESNRDARSLELLSEVGQRVRQGGWSIAGCDVTVVAEEPRLAPHADAMRRSLAEALELDTTAVGLKSTTNEGVGVIGRGEAIAAFAVALLESA